MGNGLLCPSGAKFGKRTSIVKLLLGDGRRITEGYADKSLFLGTVSRHSESTVSRHRCPRTYRPLLTPATPVGWRRPRTPQPPPVRRLTTAARSPAGHPRATPRAPPPSATAGRTPRGRRAGPSLAPSGRAPARGRSSRPERARIPRAAAPPPSPRRPTASPRWTPPPRAEARRGRSGPGGGSRPRTCPDPSRACSGA